MQFVRFFTEDAVDHLRSTIEDRLDWYYAERGDPRTWPESKSSSVKKSATTLVLDGETGTAHRRDRENALRVYDYLSDLRPEEAAEERLWVYLAHVECHQYVRSRWLGRQPKETAAAVRKVENHFFARGARALIRDNGVSRLWWMGKIARDVDGDRPGQVLGLVLHTQDIRSSLLERPAVSRNIGVLREICAVMADHLRREEMMLFRRRTFRAWMRGINARGGVVLLDALRPEALRELLQEEAEKALAGDGG